MADDFNNINITDSFKKAQRNVKQAVSNAKKSFGAMLESLRGKTSFETNIFTKTLSRNEQETLPASVAAYRNMNRKALSSTIDADHVGRLVLFSYDPKHKKTLPYYDIVPLILLVDMYPDGFLGLNMHYLPPQLRAHLLDAIVNNEIRNKYFGKERIRFNYQLLTKAAKTNLFKPCVKRYLFNHVVGGGKKFMIVPPDHWTQVLFLPYERFVKATTEQVHRDSMRKIREG